MAAAYLAVIDAIATAPTDWSWGCTGKQPHRSFADAQRAIDRLHHVDPHWPSRKLKPYRCERCQCWHIGNGLRRR